MKLFDNEPDLFALHLTCNLLADVTTAAEDDVLRNQRLQQPESSCRMVFGQIRSDAVKLKRAGQAIGV